MIRECILCTTAADGEIHFAPIGLIAEGEHLVIAPFRPSRTLDNLRAVPFAVASYTDDPRPFAGLLTDRRDWPRFPARRVPGAVLEAALAHAELAVARVAEDRTRPRFFCRVLHEENHAPFRGFNRARAAVIEAAILATRLDLLPREKIAREIAYLEIAVDKTAGAAEREAWEWLMRRIGPVLAGESP